ncbi:hypothetical protein IQ266_04810 [filamentous cyanobacterium LEGE 11480]|uniref:Transposase Synechocystis PCC 6803 domain-containing protein n=1 Tax=Romeriopsis navalis LEGE 11480 TaxID=2777977 RepID=A0A928VLZ1_9CYAN|nr:IS630 transposase-related protein [Romeriopsis navalis]MBE9029081.1 hypothetical protein [Romeriopsis navalis LEGE 11480]
MAKAYSYDFRCNVVEALELDGRKKSEVAELCNMSRSTINLWLKLKTEMGDLHERPQNPSNPSRKLTDLDKLREFVRANGDKTQPQMAELWKEDLSARTISQGLRKIGFTRKKTYGYQERDEEKRRAFLMRLATLNPELIVYMDESGMDHRDNYGYGYCEEGERVGQQDRSNSGSVQHSNGL